jgi:hypothetical protein
VAIDFFEKEVKNVQQRFNETFGVMTVCDLNLRQRTILAIIRLCRLSEKIMSSSKDKVRGEIKKFMRAKSVLGNLFDQIDKHHKQRRVHAGIYSDDRCNGRPQCTGVPELRERVQDRAAQKWR